MNTQEPISVLYTNWRGETALRHVIPQGFRYGSSEWHPEPQWLMRVYDVEKAAEREYALKDCVFADTDREAVAMAEVENLNKHFLQELLVKSAAEATGDDLASAPGGHFPQGWFLIQHQAKPIAVFPDHAVAHAHAGSFAQGLAQAALRKVTSTAS